jgi:hypothetical protein
VHGADVHAAGLTLIGAGLSDSEIARRPALPRSTVREWRRPRYTRRSVAEHCHRCWRASRPGRFEPADYAELLGLYDFTNRSADIRELFARVCRAVGADCRPAGDRVKIYRRASVALMREHVAIKA